MSATVKNLLESSCLLSREEELEAVENKDYDLLVRSQIRSTVMFVSKKSKLYGLDFDDMLSTCLVQLVQIVKTYDGSTRLITYYYRQLIWTYMDLQRLRKRDRRFVTGVEVTLEDKTLDLVETIPGNELDPLEILEKSDDKQKLLNYIEELPPALRDALHNRIEGKQFSGREKATQQQYCYLALYKLRKKFKS